VNEKNITNYLKHYGFFIPNAEIYHGLANSWDLGPLGTELKRNLKNLWWKYFITSNPYNVGCDSLITTHPQVLVASGHKKNFHDWLVECLICHKRYRLDNLLSSEEFNSFLKQENYSLTKNCPQCQKSNFTIPRKFNLLLTTNLEITENKENLVYLRPETCQGIFINFLSTQQSTRRQLPFGIGQIGKSFRNEITLHHGIFRTREFEQMELEFFCRKEEDEKWWNYWTNKAWNFLSNIIINDKKKIKQVPLTKEELPHYAKKTLDLYFKYNFGWGEVCSNSHRGNFDLNQHSQHSKHFLGIKENNKEIIPQVIEVSFGIERLMLAILEDSHYEETVKNSPLTRNLLRLHPLLAPYFVAIIPLSKQVREVAYQIYLDLLKTAPFNLTWEESSSIGKSYRRQDAIGTYYCITVDTLTITEHWDKKPNPDYNTVTLRHRNTMKQEEKRIKITDLKNYLNNLYEKYWKEFAKN
jgi:glycyl-tRNA synthetase